MDIQTVAETGFLGCQSQEIHNYGDVPNIFSFATSELSQDALLAWLIEWASPK